MLPDPLKVLINYGRPEFQDNAMWYSLFENGHYPFTKIFCDGRWCICDRLRPGVIVIGTPNLYNPMSTIDIIAHEFAHGFDQFTSRMMRNRRFPVQAISEGIADIWGAVIKANYVPEQDPWKHGEGVYTGTEDHQYNCIRNIANTQDAGAKHKMVDYFNIADYFNYIFPLGYYDHPIPDSVFEAAVHQLSGIVSHWFYLLSEGGTGSACYAMPGMGINKAAEIVFYSQLLYIDLMDINHLIYDEYNPLLFFNLIRTATLSAASLRFGDYEVQQVAMAWDAVGVTGDNSDATGQFVVCDYQTVDATTTWSDDKIVYEDLYVQEGVVLTITGNVQFAERAHLYVEPGAVLNINGGKLTSLCPNTKWQGIVVKGIQGNINHVGRVLLSNYAVIENAVIGIDMPYGSSYPNYVTCDIFTPYDGINGNGHISATKSAFINNNVAVNITAKNSADVFARFDSCTFVYDQSFVAYTPREPRVAPFKNLVVLTNVKGVNFISCHFGDEKKMAYSRAIMAHNSGFKVSSKCNYLLLTGTHCPPEDMQRSTFKGFQKAIIAERNSGDNTFEVADADFENNIVGIEVSGVINEKILGCNFKIGRSLSIQADTAQGQTNPNVSMDPGKGVLSTKSYGVWTSDSWDYQIEENYFEPTPNLYFTSTTGTYIKKSGDPNNEVYKNDYKKLDIAQNFVGQNVNDVQYYSHQGLHFLCNQFDSISKRDVEITPLMEPLKPDGVSTEQVNGRSPANLFSITAEFNINNPVLVHGTEMTYYCDVNAPNFVPQRIEGFVRLEYKNSGIVPCPSKRYTNNGGGTHPPQDWLTLYEEGKDAYNNLTYVYNNLIDGGNTEELVAEIQNEWNDDVWAYHNELLEQSPYLSQEVMQEAAVSDVLPQALYLDICLANPDATKNLDFLEQLQYDIAHPLPNYMINFIKESWGIQTARTELERMIAQNSYKKDIALNHYLGHLLTDTVDHSTEVMQWHLDRGQYTDLLSIAEAQLQSQDYTGATNTLRDLKDNEEFLKFHEAEIDDLLDYVAYRETLNEEGKNVFELDTIEVEELVLFAAQHGGRAKVFANNILCYVYDLCPEEEDPYVEPKSMRLPRPTNNDHKFDHFFVQVRPNPADTYCEFEWNFGDITGKKTLCITDLTGKQIHTRALQ
ncbi:MAG: M4 family metallopeptidase, partial [Bacteroidales bacterium]|nr:M4 family metallopeptidase [Bacteroidales bacterium]